MMARKFDYTLKTVIVGDSGVGKTCLLVRFIRNLFDDCSQPTLGVDFLSKIVETKQGRRVELQLWDTAGQELFRSVTRGYYRGSSIAFLVFDLTSRTSFESLVSWYNDIKDVAPPNVIVVLIGNKLDITEKQTVSLEEANDFAQQHHMKFFATSAKTGENVSESILSSVEDIDQHSSAAAVAQQQKVDTIIFDDEPKKTMCSC